MAADPGDKAFEAEARRPWWKTLLIVLAVLIVMAILLGFLVRDWTPLAVAATALMLYCVGLILFDLVFGLVPEDEAEDAADEPPAGGPAPRRRRRAFVSPSRGQREATPPIPPFVPQDLPIVLSQRVKILLGILGADFVALIVGLITGFWILAFIGGGAFVLGVLIVLWLASRPEKA